MLKAVVYVSVATAFLLLIVFFPNNHRIHGHLGRRLGYKSHLNFDPLIAKMERLKEERASGKGSLPALSENETVAKEIGDGHNYFSGAGRLNITLRLCILFPLVDDAPRDGFIEFKELEAWNTEQALDRLNYRTERELALMDKDGDGAITFREYLPQLDDAAMEKNGMEHGEAGWWKEQFNNADADRDGSLSFNEFRDLLHPEDSNNEEIHKWLLKEKIKRMDHHENDGKLNFMEFRERVYDNYKIYVEFESAGDHVPTAEEKFAELDVDKDKLLTVEELKPIFHYLYPGELSYARYYTSYLIYEADDDGDGKLTLNEILNHDYIFYSTVYVDGRDHDVHDEL